MNHLANSEKQTQLHQALDLIIQHATGKLPHGYRIEIDLIRGESMVILRDPDGKDITPPVDFQFSVIDSACAKAIEHSTPTETVEAPQTTEPTPQSETPSDGKPTQENAG